MCASYFWGLKIPWEVTPVPVRIRRGYWFLSSQIVVLPCKLCGERYSAVSLIAIILEYFASCVRWRPCSHGLPWGYLQSICTPAFIQFATRSVCVVGP